MEGTESTTRTPVPPEILALFRDAEAAQQFWNEHFDELRVQYPDQYVAVRHGAVIAHAGSLDELEDMLKLKGLGFRDVWFQYLSRETLELLL
jgi:hypothetical protein